eukprot:2943227-Rhodomonas_salina.4
MDEREGGKKIGKPRQTQAKAQARERRSEGTLVLVLEEGGDEVWHRRVLLHHLAAEVQVVAAVPATRRQHAVSESRTEEQQR